MGKREYDCMILFILLYSILCMHNLRIMFRKISEHLYRLLYISITDDFPHSRTKSHLLFITVCTPHVPNLYMFLQLFFKVFRILQIFLQTIECRFVQREIKHVNIPQHFIYRIFRNLTPITTS